MRHIKSKNSKIQEQKQQRDEQEQPENQSKHQQQKQQQQMHSFSETGAGVPAFLAKLWRLVDDPDTNNLICWSKDGRSFIIQNQAQFARELLPLNYKHNNMASFIRQLNMYGFHKITSIDNGGLKFDRDEMEFSHPCFKRNCPYLLEHIKRKIANTKSIDDKAAVKPEAVSKVLQDVKAMRGRQDSLDSRFSVMKQENEALWREIASLRQKHAKQQQIVNKLIQFLITIVQPSRNMTSVKRHMQLMINDTPENGKQRNASESESDCGPVIHELGEELLDEVTESDVDLCDPNSPYAKMASAHMDNESSSPLNMERPLSRISQISQNYDYSNQSIEDVLNVMPSTSGRSGAGGGGGGGVGGDGVGKSVGGGGAGAGANAKNSSVIQAVNPDGSKVVYHVTEVPDTHPNESVTTTNPPANYNEDNVLTTPMVREQMARSQMLKQKNRRRKNAGGGRADDAASISPGKMQRISAAQQQQQQQQQEQQQQQQQSSNIRIKSEQEIDPMLYLNVYPDNRVMTPDLQMISPNLNEDSRQSIGLGSSNTPTNDSGLMGTTQGLYNPNNFIADDMPADIFEDSSVMSAGENSNFENNFKLNEQQQYGQSTATSGKFSSYIAGSNSQNGASTSAAAAAAANTSSGGGADAANMPSSSSAGKRSSQQDNKNNDSNNMTVAKYNKNATNNNEGIMRLSTPDEVYGHLENVQDELDSLKDLLRSDGYSLDANTLMGSGLSPSSSANASSTAQHFNNNNNRLCLKQILDVDLFNKLFNDSDILGPFGLSLGNEGNDKKGSELMSYQPTYDLSDIIDINNQNELDNAADADANVVTPNRNQGQSQSSSVLNTPYHE